MLDDILMERLLRKNFGYIGNLYFRGCDTFSLNSVACDMLLNQKELKKTAELARFNVPGSYDGFCSLRNKAKNLVSSVLADIGVDIIDQCDFMLDTYVMSLFRDYYKESVFMRKDADYRFEKDMLKAARAVEPIRSYVLSDSISENEYNDLLFDFYLGVSIAASFDIEPILAKNESERRELYELRDVSRVILNDAGIGKTGVLRAYKVFLESDAFIERLYFHAVEFIGSKVNNRI